MSDEDRKTPVESDIAPGDGYAGDVTPEQAWKILEEVPGAVLVDCRTQPEWVFVGVPDLGKLSKKAAFVPWQVFPAMQVNPEFINQVKASGAAEEAPVLFLCRSGARSRAAAQAVTGKGFARAYNIIGGFEGAHDGQRHRGTNEGWKVAGLPWVQD
jgi:rhodanese-related sulfurtransferase